MNPPERKQVWTRHWAGGAAQACAHSLGTGAQGIVQQGWTRAFAGLPPGARVLDVGTGNGWLARLLLAARADTAWQFDGVDLAAIAPPWLDGLDESARHRIALHGGVAAEALPFDDASFDLVVSQYGIEYAERTPTLGEVLRVLRPGGGVAFVMHHAGARPVALARVEIDHIDWLLGQAGLVGATQAMLEPLARARTPQGLAALRDDRAANAARQRFNAAQDDLRARAAQRADGADVLFDAQAMVARTVEAALREGAAAARAHWDGATQALADARLRLVELQRHALDEAGVAAFAQALGRHLPACTYAPLFVEGHLMGWHLSGGAAAGAFSG